MVKFTVITYFALVFVSFVFAQDGNPGRDQWYRPGPKYDNLPRIFNMEGKCPAKEFYLDCNRCGCPDGKHAACTLIGCPEVPQIVNWESGKPCPAGRHFYWKCNDCNCSTNGREASCTRKNCPDFSKDE